MTDITFVIRDLTGADWPFSVDARGNIVDWPDGVPKPSREQIEEHFPRYAAEQEGVHARSVVRAQIAALEAAVTNRRIREATLTDVGKAWLAGVDAEITALRKQLGTVP